MAKGDLRKNLRRGVYVIPTSFTILNLFVGFPSPGGALTIAAIINYASSPVTDRRFAIVMAIVTVAVAFAMVSPIRYRSQKGLALQKERSLMYFLALALIVGLASKWPRE